MSRSVTKMPFEKCSTNRHAKRQASKKVRRMKGSFMKGNSFKKVYPSYDICDFKWCGHNRLAVIDLLNDWYGPKIKLSKAKFIKSEYAKFLAK